jgi:hypothetical protein
MTLVRRPDVELAAAWPARGPGWLLGALLRWRRNLSLRHLDATQLRDCGIDPHAIGRIHGVAARPDPNVLRW